MTHQKDLKLEALAKATELRYLGMNGRQSRAKTEIQVQWLPPSPPHPLPPLHQLVQVEY